jgi:cytochrome c peroxidase
MKRYPLLALAATFTVNLAAGATPPGVLDLTRLENYAKQAIPAYITRDNTPPDNPITDAGATLGRVLFHDLRLSKTNTVSCASCHDQAHAFSDPDLASTGVAGTTGRHSMRLVNARFAREPRFFWDERAPTLEHQSTQPIRDHVEMGFSGTAGDPDFAALTAKLAAIPEYRVLFAMTYGDTTVTETRIQKSLAQFVRSIQSFDSKYDAGRTTTPDDQDFPNFTEQENQGKRQFMLPVAQGGANCASCHTPPTFDIDPASLNNGVIGKIGGGQDLTNTRSPSLRDLMGPAGPNGPFMHDGSMMGLGQITNHYRSAIPDNPNLDPRLRRPALPFTNAQLAPLRAFLHTLTGSSVYQDPKWASPFTAGGALELLVLPASALRIESGTPGTLTLRGQVAPNLDYRIEASPSLGLTGTWQTIATLRSDATGLLEHPVAMTAERMFYRLVFDVPAP